MEKRIEAAAILAAALMRDHPNPSTEKVAELLMQAIDAVDLAIGMENRRNAKKIAELRMNTLPRRK